MSLVGQAYDESGSWGRLSRDWPFVEFQSIEEYNEAWDFCVANPPRQKVIPYGSYVSMLDYRRYHSYESWIKKYGEDAGEYANFVIRVETEEYKKLLLEHMKTWSANRQAERKDSHMEGEWNLDRLDKLVQGVRAGDQESVFEANALCAVLNRLNNLTEVRIAGLEIKSAAPVAVAVTFGDKSRVSLTRQEAVKFLTSYILERDSYIAIMEANRVGDPRVTGELQRLKDDVERLTTELVKVKEGRGE